MIGHNPEGVLVSKNLVVQKIGHFKPLIGQICKNCASTINGLKAIAKKVGHHIISFYNHVYECKETVLSLIHLE